MTIEADYRVLNHLPLIQRKLAVGRRWRLIDQSDHASPQGRRAQDIAEALQKGDIAPDESLNMVAEFAGGSPDQLIVDLENVYATGLLEFHPTDACNLDCIDCWYGRSRATIPFEAVSSVVTTLRPAAITVTGGGEPTMYNSQGKGINELTHLLRGIAPAAQLGMINNNVYLPSGDWPDHYAWQRTSIDAASAQVYERVKRRDFFKEVVANTKHLLLRSRIGHVGIGFLYRRPGPLQHPIPLNLTRN
jgi:hypothetical protein